MILLASHFTHRRMEKRESSTDSQENLQQEELFIAFLNYRSTATTATGYRLARLLMGRQLTTPVSASEKNVFPKWPREKRGDKLEEKVKKKKACKHFSKRCHSENRQV